MYFFPNLQIIFNVSPPPPSAPSVVVPPVSASSTQTSTSPTISQVFQRILRNPSETASAGAAAAESATSVQTDDVHFYVNLDAMYPPAPGLTIEQIHEVSDLEVMEPGNASVLCTICQNACEPGSVIQTLRQCRHRYHPVCIQRWLVLHNSCPVCRTSLVSS